MLPCGGGNHEWHVMGVVENRNFNEGTLVDYLPNIVP
jgi:hypothetical protein